jgi:hypothetical protein
VPAAGALHPDAVRRILAHRVGMAAIEVEDFGRLSAHALRVGFITAAYEQGARDEPVQVHHHVDGVIWVVDFVQSAPYRVDPRAS